MYHPGKVVKVFRPKDKDVISADDSVHALVSMWDENVFTVIVDSRLADKLKEGDVVIVDYYPIAAQSQIPKRVIVKILRGKAAEILWEQYANYKEKQALHKELQESQEYHG